APLDRDQLAQLRKALAARGQQLYRAGSLEKSLRAAQGARAVAERLQDEPAVVETLTTIGRLLASGGQKREAREALDEAARRGEKAGDRRGVALAWAQLAYVSFNEGDYPQARALYARSLTVLEELGSDVDTAGVLSGLGQTQRQMG